MNKSTTNPLIEIVNIISMLIQAIGALVGLALGLICSSPLWLPIVIVIIIIL